MRLIQVLKRSANKRIAVCMRRADELMKFPVPDQKTNTARPEKSPAIGSRPSKPA